MIKKFLNIPFNCNTYSGTKSHKFGSKVKCPLAHFWEASHALDRKSWKVLDLVHNIMYSLTWPLALQSVIHLHFARSCSFGESVQLSWISLQSPQELFHGSLNPSFVAKCWEYSCASIYINLFGTFITSSVWWTRRGIGQREASQKSKFMQLFVRHWEKLSRNGLSASCNTLAVSCILSI